MHMIVELLISSIAQVNKDPIQKKTRIEAEVRWKDLCQGKALEGEFPCAKKHKEKLKETAQHST